MTPYLTYKFTKTSDYGAFNDLYAWATIILSFMVFRMDTAYFRFASKNDRANEAKVYSNTFIFMASISTVVVVLMLLFKNTIANFLGYPEHVHYISWFAFILAFDAYTTLIYARFRLDGRPMRFMFFRVVNVVLNVLFVLFFLEVMPKYFPGLKNIISQFTGANTDLDLVFFSNLLASLIVFLMMIPEYLKMKISYDKKLMADILKYSWPLVIIIVAGNINQFVSVPLQNFLLEGDLETRRSLSGIFGAGAKLAILLNLFTTAFNYAAEPFFFNQAAKDNKLAMNGVVAKAFTVFCAFVVLGIYFYVDLAILLIGPKYRSGVGVVPFMLLSYLFLGLYYNVSIWYKIADKTIYGAYIAMQGVVVTLVVSFILLPWIGIMGSAWASLACFVYMAAAGYLQGQKHYPIDYPVKSILYYCAVTTVLLLVAYLVRSNFENIWLRMAINSCLLIGFCSYIYIFDRPFIQKYLLKS